MLIEMYAVFAQLQIEKKEKRQQEDFETKKLRGEWGDYKQFTAAYARVVNREIGPTDLRRELGLTHATFYRYRARYLKNNP